MYITSGLSLQYDCLVFDGKVHHRMATLPGMWDRTVTVGSAGSKQQSFICSLEMTNPFSEAFAATGWRVGWLIGPKWIIQPTLAATTRIVFCTNSPLQDAAACGLEQANERRFFETQRAEYLERRAVLTSTFDEMALKYTLPEGGYFILLVRNTSARG
jgi:kynurenine aminotransferase